MLPEVPGLPAIPIHQRTPLVDALLAIIAQQHKQIAAQQEQIAVQKEQIQGLKDEIARLKGHKPKPKIRPSALERDSKTPKGGKRPGSAKRSKTAELKIHETVNVPPENLPPGSEFQHSEPFTVVGLRFEPHNIRYWLETWKTPDGRLAVQEVDSQCWQLTGVLLVPRFVPLPVAVPLLLPSQ